jgi:L-amino acid N-acyltransferase YncA
LRSGYDGKLEAYPTFGQGRVNLNGQQTPDLKVRPATGNDAAVIAEIYNHYVDVGGATFETEYWTTSQATKYLQFDPPDVWLVAQSVSNLLGWASARRYSLRGGYKFTCETAIYLAPSAVGKGVADTLQQSIDDHCRGHQMHHAVAKIIADNERSMSFHRRHGYELVGIQKEIGRIDDNWIDVAIMQKIYR